MPNTIVRAAEGRPLSTAAAASTAAIVAVAPTNMAEAARKGEFMASCRTSIEWNDFDQVQFINALTPGGEHWRH
ncbi:hypothetical protein [Mesorhizobium sangaii]|uniref:Uncharacterized protein n=1 Tax=Mesorhizobium sangaii TaxID=505389 RepID=A0A841P6E9_9HYPH|nr:hypothetical protein [Mesorhizobium sangaii]MBB6410807.1 hypothetical protein [Mesorhizobium sangaii]